MTTRLAGWHWPPFDCISKYRPPPSESFRAFREGLMIESSVSVSILDCEFWCSVGSSACDLDAKTSVTNGGRI
jgi:hypothetical protein